MTARTLIALDVMGGDRAPDIVVNGAHIARERFPDVDFLMVGDEAKIRPLLDRLPGLAKVSQILHTDQAVRSDEKPSVALRSGRKSSMRLALDAVSKGDAAAAVSAGNTGALMAMAKLSLRMLPGIDRPAIASFFPTQRGESVMLDLGANVTCDADNLVQFALLGDVFARTVLGLVAPSIGILNVGEEEMKGREEVREAAIRLRRTHLAPRLHGFVEGDDIPKGTVDVIVADGFTGNIALKTAEGTSRLVGHFLKESIQSNLLAKIGYLFLRPALTQFRSRIDPRRYNGAVFLGLGGIAVKSHGGTDALGFANAIGVAVDMTINGFIEKLRAELEQVQSVLAQTGDDAVAE
ncbi:phosphate acyltransferase PlsX [Lacibacterium aquatile]|uniref:Phosphate acyltransferase n=1 Tax=Lacibacterium aquatile TaxID=1168082 RepID=A0ABW5DS84_9PROT